MENKRRKFMKMSSVGALGLVGANVFSAPSIESKSSNLKLFGTSEASFNMSGYSAPKLNEVRIGFIGLGMRGPGAVKRMSLIEGVSIKALCDLREESVMKSKELLKGTDHEPDLYYGSAYAWKEMVDRDDIDLIYIATPWDWHTPMAVYAMESDKHVAVEVPAAKTIDEAWELVETSERTKKHCMMLENCCYDFFELLTLNMARQNYFGEIIHGEGAYIHNLLDLNFDKNEGYESMWRLEENAARNGNLYPTHGLGPICQIMNINRGDRMDYLNSLSSADFDMQNRAKQYAKDDAFFSEYANRTFRGNMNTTLIKTNMGRSIMVQHDVSSPRPYSRIHMISGTKAFAQKWPTPGKIAVNDQWLKDAEMKSVEKKYTPELIKKVGKLAKKIGGHGGMDFIMDWRLIDCLRNGLPLDQDVYDAALWSAIGPLSEQSIANRSNAIDVPDFTRGNWKSNEPVDIGLKGAGNTSVYS
ncbi:gfo/Idh/MocA family oxidoreductase [Zobellia amurskyensis]|uniref:Gfo/Idh/MocA family oxidoreductase n=1 Tax=Zobellia amurskyensis TaxID=248905 RepID=A0A7X2ZQL4_9FLAO|nr:Gfo/Idh/MocA family oxidoreductase [Zobellia amurskyensis]MUH34575.1 gfo/Idh/MocA family oxidoreductase [Zobellia amurskyensis]